MGPTFGVPRSSRHAAPQAIAQRGIDICHETVRCWWNRFGLIFANHIRKERIYPNPNHSNWRWHLDEVFVRINGEQHYLWRAVDHEGEVYENSSRYNCQQ